MQAHTPENYLRFGHEDVMAFPVVDSWKIIHDTLQNQCKVLFDALAKPATKLQISAIERRLGASLPCDLVESLLTHNGMVDSYLGVNRLFDYEALLSTKTILSQWGMMTQMQRDGFFDGGCPLTRTRKIKNDRWWNPLWVPITDADGSGYCVDLDPGAGGIKGQVFYFYHNGARPRKVVAKTYAEWLDRIARKMSRKQYTIDDGSIWLD